MTVDAEVLTVSRTLRELSVRELIRQLGATDKELRSALQASSDAPISGRRVDLLSRQQRIVGELRRRRHLSHGSRRG